MDAGDRWELVEQVGLSIALEPFRARWDAHDCSWIQGIVQVPFPHDFTVSAAFDGTGKPIAARIDAPNPLSNSGRDSAVRVDGGLVARRWRSCG